jgi:hypothetical protein
MTPVLFREAGEREDVAGGLSEVGGGVREPLGELLDDPGVLGPDRRGVGLLEDGPHEGGDHRLGGLGDLGEQVAHVVGPAALPARADQRRGDGVDEAGVGVADDQRGARQASGDEAAQERQPPGAVFGGDHVEAEDLPVPVGVDPDGDHDRDVDDPAALADLLGQGVHPHIGVGPGIEGPVAELGDGLVELGGHAGHLGLGKRLDSQGLHEPVDAPGGHTADIALGHHRDEGLLGPSAGIEEPVREVAGPPQLRDRQLDRADPRVEGPLAVAVAVVEPLRRLLTPARSSQGVDLGGHQPLGELGHHLPEQIVLVAVELLAQPRQRVHRVADHRVLPLVALSQELQEADAVVIASGGPSPATPLPGTQLRETAWASVR